MVTTKLEINGIFRLFSSRGVGPCVYLPSWTMSCRVTHQYYEHTNNVCGPCSYKTYTLFEQHFIWDFKGNV